MLELSNERIDQMMHEETPPTEELSTLLRCIYSRYIRLYEKYFADIDELNDDMIAELRIYHEETKSLIKYYYMDIPLETYTDLNEFDNDSTARLLGPDWHKFVSESYREFIDEKGDKNKSKECLKAEFADHILDAFYDDMDSVFREAFGTTNKTVDKVTKSVAKMLFTL